MAFVQNLAKRMIDGNEREVARMFKQVRRINSLEPGIKALSDEELRGKTEVFKQRLQLGETLDDLLVEAFAVAREGAWRSLGMRPYDVQLVGAMVLHSGKIAEMKTGEGKTLVGPIALYLNALAGKGCHLVTTNDYLVRWQAQWMGTMFEFLGMTCGYIQQNMEPAERRANYLKDVTYVENSELGFDYLRDNMAGHPDHLVLRDLNYAIVDEVDSILVDEARTPLIISGMPQKTVQFYEDIDRITSRLRGTDNEEEKEDFDYFFEEKFNQVALTERGQERVEKMLGIDNLSDPQYLDINHHVQASLKAHALFKVDQSYVVIQGEVVIVDEFTGHPQPGRRYSDGLHQAIEAKEHVRIQQARQTVASITYQNFFRLFNKIAGMTGTAKTEETEFRQIYGMSVVMVPTNLPVVRKDYPDAIYKNKEAKYRGIVSEIANMYVREQPVLVGTRSVEVSEYLATRLAGDKLRRHCLILLLQDRLYADKSPVPKDEQETLLQLLRASVDELGRHELAPVARRLGVAEELDEDATLDALLALIAVEVEKAAPELVATYRERLRGALADGIPFNILNARQHEREGQIIADAGSPGQVTIATNMAGRGVDIVLGGKPADAKQNLNPELHAKVKSLGGLHVLGTERHESRRIDNQLRGRSGRQGDPGASRFFVALDDELMKLFGPERFGFFMKGWPEEQVLEHSIVSKSLERAQQKVELRNYQIRKDTLKYDDVMNEQRNVIYGERRRVLQGGDVRESVLGMIRQAVDPIITQHAPAGMTPEDWDLEALFRALAEAVPGLDKVMKPEQLYEMHPREMREDIHDLIRQYYELREQAIGDELMRHIERSWLLRIIDGRWMEHLQEMDYLRDSIYLRAYGQRDPFLEFAREAHQYFEHLLQGIAEDLTQALFLTEVAIEEPSMQMQGLETESRMLAPVAQDLENVETPMSEAADEMRGKARTVVAADGPGRNELCPCGSGKKYKKCCGKDS
ncbi:MAG TPA: preprotein translocase subunit SecA [Armatimonadota bacterium]|jgi:preprotein translocase subunit SecA